MPKTANGSVRHLWVLRHGKAASDAPWGGGDRERPLTARGRRDATALGRRLAGEKPVLGLEGVRRPELAICSAAVRTNQTARLIAKAMSNRLPIDSFRSLYGADTGVVLGYVREIDESVKSALVVGHNPTMYELVWELLADEDGDLTGSDRAVLEAHRFPTCALAVLSLQVDAWEDVVAGCGSLAGLFKPPY
ncbi:MAG TPA: histidine phosphatase family protein [Acidimicrobiales bacterium]|jgi:phosphohistidine phosphatase|nr:histidine phosphatase family protein [Acidimicrobiales bacterium]